MSTLEIVYLEGDAPLQALGYINGYPWYFRARTDQWLFSVGSRRDRCTEEAILASVGKGYGLVLSRRYFDTTTMSEEMAEQIIRRCAAAFLAYKAEQ